MAIFDLPKKKEEPGQPMKKEVPVQQVIVMKEKGLSNNQIIQNLQRDGYKSHQIFDALNQAELRSGNVEAKPWPASGKPIEQPEAPSQPGDTTQPVVSPQPAGMPEEPPLMPEAPELHIPEPKIEPPIRHAEPPAERGKEADLFEELAEAIIDEKWGELMKHVNKIVEWKERTDSRLLKIETEFQNIKQSFDKLQKGILGKVSEYDQNIRDVGAEIKGMEQVFQKIIPELTGNVDQLSRLTKELKGRRVKKEE